MVVVGKTNEVFKCLRYELRILLKKLVIPDADLHVLKLNSRVRVTGEIYELSVSTL
jgi:hypothetical protein